MQAELRGASQVNDRFERAIFDQFSANAAVDFILSFIEVALTVHNFTEDMAIGEGRPFREEDLLGLFYNGLVPEKAAGVESIELEGEGPSFRIFIVIFEDVASRHMLPLINGFFND